MARGYRPQTAAAAVARCRELGWVGDTTFAHERARTLRARGAGCLRITADLAARGLPETLVDEAVAASREDLAEADWARRALERAGRPGGAGAWRLLVGRGFPEEVVADLLGEDAG